MSAETIIMPLTFATFFICSVKGLTNLHQRTCVNYLLKGILSEKAKEGGYGVISDADCSNYANGKRKLSTDIQIELSKLPLEEIIKRLKGIDIWNFTTAADALKLLVENSSLSEKEKEALLKNYEADQELTFIAKVFLRSVRENNNQQLTRTQMDILNGYRDSYSIANDKNDILGIPEHQKQVNRTETDLHNDTENGEDISWMGDYASASIIEKPLMPSDREVVLRHDEIKLPKEYSWMLYILKPALTEAKLRKYSMNDFFKVLDIDAGTKNLQEGQLEYWQFKGAIDSIIVLLKRINFSDACGFVLQPVGVFELSQIENVEEVLRVASNVNVTMCTPLIFKDVPDFKLLLLVHRSKRKSIEQSLDTDHDNTRIYEKKRNPDNGYISH